MEENKTHYVRIAQACYPAADWPDVVLMAGEVGWESDTGKFKRGDGQTTWSRLPYYEQTKIGEKQIATEEYVQTEIEKIDIPEVDLKGYATEKWVQEQNYLTEHQDLSTYATQKYVNDATKDLANKNDIPTVPSKTSDLTNDSGYLTDATGITEEEFSNRVRTEVNNMELQIDSNTKGYYGFGYRNSDGSWFDKNVCEYDPSWAYIALLDVRKGTILGIFEKSGEGETDYLFSSNGDSALTDLSWYVQMYNWKTENPNSIFEYGYVIQYGDTYCKLMTLPLQAWHYCLREDTTIPMEDGTYKLIKDIKPKDKVGFYNTFNHSKVLQYNMVCVPSLISKPKEYKTFTFSNGNVLHIGGNHMLFNVEADAIVGSNDWKIGMHGIDADGKEIELLSIEEKENIEGYTFYNIFTRHYRYLANGVLCGHSQAALGAEFVKYSNKQYRFKDTEYMNYLYRKNLEREMMTKEMIPIDLIPQINNIRQKYNKYRREEKDEQQYLDKTDYQVTKYLSGLITEEEHQKSEALREKSRIKIREARKKLQEEEALVLQEKNKFLDTISPVKGVW